MQLTGLKLFTLYINNLFVTSKNEFKVLQNVFKIKKEGLKCFKK